MDILKYADICTNHIKEENSNLILETKGFIFSDKYDVNIYGFPYEEGTFIVINECDYDGLHDLYMDGFDDIVSILRYCIENNIKTIRFDADANESNLFQTFEW